jgi:hypothetical protein
MDKIEQRWAKVATDLLVGRTIVRARYMSEGERESMGWHSRPVVLQLDDGNMIYSSSDDEGNDAGAMFTNSEKHPVLPVI